VLALSRAYPTASRHLLLAAPIDFEDYRLYVPPTPSEKILENEDKLTAKATASSWRTNYSLKLPPDQVTPFIDARFNIKGSSEYPRWLRAFVNSAQLIYRSRGRTIFPCSPCRPIVMGADDHNAPGRPNAPEALRPKMGQNAELAKAFAAKMANAKAEVIPTRPLVFLEGRQKFDELMLHSLSRVDGVSWICPESAHSFRI